MGPLRRKIGDISMIYKNSYKKMVINSGYCLASYNISIKIKQLFEENVIKKLKLLHPGANVGLQSHHKASWSLESKGIWVFAQQIVQIEN